MIYSDLHIHIGRSLDGKPVKITAAATLTLPNILKEARDVKGLSLIGLVDAHSNGVRRDFAALLNEGTLKPLPGGGYQAGELTVIPGTEVELDLGSGSAHFLAYYPEMAAVEEYVKRLKPYVRNWQLSSQKAYVPVEEWIEAVEVAEGVWLPAHAFTPHKGIYGNCCRRLLEVLPKMPLGLEIGLSADRKMARSLSELDRVELFSNSDAHSLPNLAREYNALSLTENSFEGLRMLLEKKGGKLVANYGLMPEVGKYHRTYCLVCEEIVQAEPPVLVCPYCGHDKVVMGVLDRLALIADRPLRAAAEEALPKKLRIETGRKSPGESNSGEWNSGEWNSGEWNSGESTYRYQVPLRQLPGIGPKIFRKLLDSFGTEMAVLHEVPLEALTRVAGEKIASLIERSRRGTLQVSAGGGGIFGKVVDVSYGADMA